MDTETVCSAAHKKRKYRREVVVDAMSSNAVPFVIIPMGLGEHSVEVKASVYDSTFSDGVKKDLLVVVSALLRLSPTSNHQHLNHFNYMLIVQLKARN